MNKVMPDKTSVKIVEVVINPPLYEELLAINDCWEKVNQFSSRMQPMSHYHDPADGPTSINPLVVLSDPVSLKNT